MIDFRYHLVSLISVFLALAVGVVLGAGPLRENLGTQLAGQVEQLRTEKDQLRAENSRLSGRNDDLSSYIVASAPALVAGTLTGTSVAIITDDASTRDAVTSTVDLVEKAGGSVPVRITLGTRLWDPAQQQARASALQELSTAAPSLSLTGDDDVQRLAGAISRVLTAPSAELPSGQREKAVKALTDAQLVTVDGQLEDPVNAVVLAGADPSELAVGSDDTAAASARAQAVISAQTSLLLILAERDVPCVVVGTDPADSTSAGIVKVARSDGRLAAVSTVDGLQRADGPPVAVLALAEQTHGGAGSYGTGAEAQSRMPGVQQTADASDGGGG